MVDLRLFQLLEDLRPEGTARAVLLNWKGTRYVPSSEKIELFEFAGTHGNKGDRGYCYLSPHSNQWETLSGLFQQIPQWAAH